MRRNGERGLYTNMSNRSLGLTAGGGVRTTANEVGKEGASDLLNVWAKAIARVRSLSAEMHGFTFSSAEERGDAAKIPTLPC